MHRKFVDSRVAKVVHPEVKLLEDRHKLRHHMKSHPVSTFGSCSHAERSRLPVFVVQNHRFLAFHYAMLGVG
jgi:hypothetical protein